MRIRPPAFAAVRFRRAVSKQGGCHGSFDPAGLLDLLLDRGDLGFNLFQPKHQITDRGDEVII